MSGQFSATEFKFIRRGYADTLVFIPGWATDYRIFSQLNLNYNYLLSTRFSADDFNAALLRQLEKIKMHKVSLLGFSLGGFLATEFAQAYPEKIEELILAGIRSHYPAGELSQIKEQLKKNRRVWLYKFYRNCFSRLDTQGLSWFKKNLLKEYLEKLNLRELLQGLDYLGNYFFKPEALNRLPKISIFHGSLDKVVSFSEALEIKSRLPQAGFFPLSGLGHIPFLNPVFAQRFSSE